jgi:hypothetical protein
MDGGIAAGWPDRRAGSLECLGAVAQDRSTGCRDRALRVGPEEYAGILFELGYVEQHVRLQVYPHVLDSSRDVVELARGATRTRFHKCSSLKTLQNTSLRTSRP